MGQPNGLTRDFDCERQQGQQAFEVGYLRLQRSGTAHFVLHANGVAIHSVRVMHRAHREQVLEKLAALAVVGDSHVAVHSTPQSVLYDSH